MTNKEVDFTGVEEAQPFASIPPGDYLVEVADVRVRRSQGGAEMWGVHLVVAEGPYKGRSAAWDNLVWSPRSLGRVKRALRLMGFPVEGKLTLAPEDLKGKKVRVRLIPDEYVNPNTGRKSIRNRVPFGGYLDPEGEEGSEAEEMEDYEPEDCPF